MKMNFVLSIFFLYIYLSSLNIQIFGQNCRHDKNVNFSSQNTSNIESSETDQSAVQVTTADTIPFPEFSKILLIKRIYLIIFFQQFSNIFPSRNVLQVLFRLSR